MSLPLPYRPQGVLELAEEEKRAGLKMVLKKNYLFINGMIAWYQNLSVKQRATLTKKTLFRRALFEAHRLKMLTASIPHDWVETMKKECGLVCYISKNALAVSLTVFPITP